MNSSSMVLSSLAAGVLIGILFAPASGKATRSKITKAGNTFDSKLEKELKKFDKAIKKQIKNAKKEIKELVEAREHHSWAQDVNNSVS